MDVEEAYDATLATPGIQSDYYNDMYLQVFRPRHVLLARAMMERLQGRREVIADIGCQNGFFLRLAAHLGFKRLMGVDYFQLPPERSYLTGLEDVTFLKANFNEDLFLRKIEDQSVDCVVSTEVFEHVYHHPLGYLMECTRVLRPGGLLLFSMPNPATLANAMRLIRGQPMSWGGVAFAETPKITSEGTPLAVWDIHFREYNVSEFREIVEKIPDLELLESGFLATASYKESSFVKRFAKKLQWAMGGGRSRLLASTQYAVLRRKSGESKTSLAQVAN